MSQPVVDEARLDGFRRFELSDDSEDESEIEAAGGAVPMSLTAPLDTHAREDVDANHENIRMVLDTDVDIAPKRVQTKCIRQPMWCPCAMWNVNTNDLPGITRIEEKHLTVRRLVEMNFAENDSGAVSWYTNNNSDFNSRMIQLKECLKRPVGPDVPPMLLLPQSAGDENYNMSVLDQPRLMLYLNGEQLRIKAIMLNTSRRQIGPVFRAGHVFTRPMISAARSTDLRLGTLHKVGVCRRADVIPRNPPSQRMVRKTALSSFIKSSQREFYKTTWHRYLLCVYVDSTQGHTKHCFVLDMLNSPFAFMARSRRWDRDSTSMVLEHAPNVKINTHLQLEVTRDISDGDDLVLDMGDEVTTGKIMMRGERNWSFVSIISTLRSAKQNAAIRRAQRIRHFSRWDPDKNIAPTISDIQDVYDAMHDETHPIAVWVLRQRGMDRAPGGAETDYLDEVLKVFGDHVSPHVRSQLEAAIKQAAEYQTVSDMRGPGEDPIDPKVMDRLQSMYVDYDHPYDSVSAEKFISKTSDRLIKDIVIQNAFGVKSMFCFSYVRREYLEHFRAKMGTIDLTYIDIYSMILNVLQRVFPTQRELHGIEFSTALFKLSLGSVKKDFKVEELEWSLSDATTFTTHIHHNAKLVVLYIFSRWLNVRNQVYEEKMRTYSKSNEPVINLQRALNMLRAQEKRLKRHMNRAGKPSKGAMEMESSENLVGKLSRCGESIRETNIELVDAQKRSRHYKEPVAPPTQTFTEFKDNMADKIDTLLKMNETTCWMTLCSETGISSLLHSVVTELLTAPVLDKELIVTCYVLTIVLADMFPFPKDWMHTVFIETTPEVYPLPTHQTMRYIAMNSLLTWSPTDEAELLEYEKHNLTPEDLDVERRWYNWFREHRQPEIYAKADEIRKRQATWVQSLIGAQPLPRVQARTLYSQYGDHRFSHQSEVRRVANISRLEARRREEAAREEAVPFELEAAPHVLADGTIDLTTFEEIIDLT
jgi:hypothetical protein